MPRKERPLDAGDSAVLAFARELRSLRERAGSPTYRRLSSMLHYSEAAGHSDAVNALAVSPDGRRLASGSGDFSARIWDVAQRRVTTHLTGGSHVVKSVAFSPGGTLLASDRRSRQLHLVTHGVPPSLITCCSERGSSRSTPVS